MSPTRAVPAHSASDAVDGEELHGAVWAPLEDVVRVTHTLVPLYLDVPDITRSLWASSKRVHEQLRHQKQVWADLCLRHWPDMRNNPMWALTREVFCQRYGKAMREEQKIRKWETALRSGQLSCRSGRSPAAPPVLLPGLHRLSSGYPLGGRGGAILAA
mmetsp:Transcript_18908/g.43974  ORF Transcript_18908/g.43974 Transcript_18908/m.43974 type:complete len:159 (+) Transcript_18908:141-617(+)|eukprot:CAMPEP_0178439044 /NCGR_PEP_ID=MMETSP0689_2-20121128/35937_1 /TAXON_ID=160604 /ORGANISM="Amphidinium massartii, Strain CS-259" /LENGTH=158 /DNA_ID=CAMNT_0020061529 /DNA_START=121 /DNA_END=597 /DNA_ORIENTATION=-